MRRIRKYLRKVSGVGLVEGAGELQRSTEATAEMARKFGQEVQDYALAEATRDLLRRIEALEAELRIMKNGSYPKIKLP